MKQKASMTNEPFRICVLSHRFSANTIAKQLTKILKHKYLANAIET